MRFNPLHNLPLKIGALLLALLLWVHVATNKPYEYQFELPLVIDNIPAGLLQTNPLPASIAVRVKTSGKQLIVLDANQPRLRISAAEYREGTFERDLTDNDAMTSFDEVYENVTIVAPRKLFLRFEREVEKSVLVKSRVSVTPQMGFMTVGPVKIVPEMVRLSGPASAMKRIQEIETETLELSGLTAETTRSVRLAVADSLGITLGDSVVDVIAMVEPMVERRLADQIVHTPHDFDTGKYRFSPREVDIRIGLPQSLLTANVLRNVRVSFLSPELEADSIRVGLRVKVPPDAIYLPEADDSITVTRKQ